MRRLLLPYLALWILGALVVRWALVPAEACPAIEAADMHAASVAAGEWLATNLDQDGTFTYGYDRSTDVVNNGYNIVRHAGASMSLFQLAGAGGEVRFLDPGERAAKYLLDHALIRHDGWVAVAEDGQPGSLGATALALAAMGTRRDATGDHSRDDLMRGFGRFIVAQQQADGSILVRWDRETKAPVPYQYDVFATGEAVWGLAMLHRMFPGEGWDAPALGTMAYLASGARERSEGEITRIPDHWAAYALEELGRSGLVDEQLAAYAERLAGYFSLRLRVETQRTGTLPNVVVRGFPGPPSGVGTAGEGLAALYRMAGTDSRLAGLRHDMGERLVCMAGLMSERQVTAGEAVADPRPELTEGAWFYRSYTQVDDQQHVLSAIIGAEGVAEEDR